MRKNRANGLPIGSGLYWKRGIIYVKIWHGGEMLGQFSTGTNDVYQALKWKDTKLAELIKAADENAIKTAKGVRVKALLEDYIDHLKRKEEDAGSYGMVREYERNSYKTGTRINAHLMPAFGRFLPKELTDDMLVAYRDRRRKVASVSTVNSEGRILRAALRRGTKKKTADGLKVHPSHIAGLDWSVLINAKQEAKAARTGTVSDEQYEAIMQHAPEHLKPVFCTVMYTGIRQKECKFIRREQLDMDACTITLKADETKEGKPRVAPINERVKAVLAEWIEWTNTNYPKTRWLFHQNGEQLGSFKTAWNATLRRAGLRVQVINPDGTPKVKKAKTPGKNGKHRLVKVWKNLVRFHDSRRTNITELDNDDVQEKDIMRVSGHQTVSMSRRYNQGKKAAERVRQAQNKRLGYVGSTEAPTSAPATPKSDWKAELRELKGLLDDGVLSREEFAAEKARVLASR